MKTLTFSTLFSALWMALFSAAAAGVHTYDVYWSIGTLDATFILDVESEFGSYSSSWATGSSLEPEGRLTSVTFEAQPTYAEITFDFDEVFLTEYLIGPAHAGRSSSWSTADEAWRDLIRVGPADGLYLTIVPEPAFSELLIGAVVIGLSLGWRPHGS